MPAQRKYPEELREREDGAEIQARKVWRQLRRDGIQAARCTVEGLMKELGVAGAAVSRKRPRTQCPRVAC